VGNLDVTLEQLEGKNWGEPTYNSYLVRTIHALRRKSIRLFTVEDLRITLGQKMGMEPLVPLALDRLEADPFAEGDFYPGDLLSSVMGLPRDYWSAHPREATRMALIARRVEASLPGRDEVDSVKKHLSTLLAEAPWQAP